MSNRHSKWHKEIGGDWGCVKIKNKWIWYDCLICAREKYPDKFNETPRWQGPPSKAIIAAKINRINERVPCDGAAIHKRFFERKMGLYGSE